MEKITSMKDVISIASEYTTSEEEDVQKCLDRLHKITDVPAEVANKFSNDFGKGATTTQYEAVKNLIEYVNQNKQK